MFSKFTFFYIVVFCRYIISNPVWVHEVTFMILFDDVHRWNRPLMLRSYGRNGHKKRKKTASECFNFLYFLWTFSEKNYFFLDFSPPFWHTGDVFKNWNGFVLLEIEHELWSKIAHFRCFLKYFALQIHVFLHSRFFKIYYFKSSLGSPVWILYKMFDPCFTPLSDY